MNKKRNTLRIEGFKNAHRAMLLLLAVLLLFTVTGCQGKSKLPIPRTLDEQKTQIADHLMEKYGEEFEWVSPLVRSEPLSGHNKFYLYPKGGDPETENFALEVWVSKKDGHLGYSDDYFGIYIKDEYEKVVREELDKEFKEYKLVLEMQNNTTDSGAPLDKNTTLDQIYDITMTSAKRTGWTPEKNPHLALFSPGIIVALPRSYADTIDVEAKLKRFMEDMAGRKLVCSCTMMLYEDEYYQKEFLKERLECYRSYLILIRSKDLTVDETIMLKP